MSLTFSIPGTSETQTEGFPYEIFRHRETKYFQRKIVILLCIKFFDTPNFLKFWSDAREIFRHCETIIIRRKNVIPPVMHKIFRYPKFFETLEGCPRNVLALWDQKFSTENRDTPSSLPPPPLIHIFFDTRFFLIHRSERFPYEIFQHCETDIFWRKIVILPPPLPPLFHKFFRYQKFSKTKKGSPTKYFRYCETTIFFIENRAIPLLGIKFFDTQNFLRHRRFPRRNFSELWDENFSTENRDTLLHKVHKSVVELMFVRFFWKLISKQ